jgi:hypothetical protein
MNPRPKDAATDAAAVHVTGTKQHECLISPCGQDSSIGFRVRVWGYAGCRLAWVQGGPVAGGGLVPLWLLLSMVGSIQGYTGCRLSHAVCRDSPVTLERNRSRTCCSALLLCMQFALTKCCSAKRQVQQMHQAVKTLFRSAQVLRWRRAAA